MQLNQISLTALDFETTGSVPGFEAEAWQIGLVALERGRVLAAPRFESLIRVDPQRPFNRYAPGEHHRRRAKIAAAPPPAAIWHRIEPLVCNRPLVAHNVAVEKKFLRRMAPLHRLGPWVDTLQLARRAWPGAPSHKLEALIPALGLSARVRDCCPIGGPHDALYDAVASAVLLEYLLQQPGWSQLEV